MNFTVFRKYILVIIIFSLFFAGCSFQNSSTGEDIISGLLQNGLIVSPNISPEELIHQMGQPEQIDTKLVENKYYDLLDLLTIYRYPDFSVSYYKHSHPTRDWEAIVEIAVNSSQYQLPYGLSIDMSRDDLDTMLTGAECIDKQVSVNSSKIFCQDDSSIHEQIIFLVQDNKVNHIFWANYPSGYTETPNSNINFKALIINDDIINNNEDKIVSVRPVSEYAKDYAFDLQQITKEYFVSAKKNALPLVNTPMPIKDYLKVKEMLKGRVVFKDYEEADGSINGILLSFTTKDGLIKNFSDYDLYFIAYFPDPDVLFLEGGHASEYCYNLSTGQGPSEVGNPAQNIEPQEGDFRLVSYDNGQKEIRFLQDISSEQPFKIAEITDINPNEWLSETFWTDKNTLYFRIGNTYYYYKLLIISKSI